MQVRPRKTCLSVPGLLGWAHCPPVSPTLLSTTEFPSFLRLNSIHSAHHVWLRPQALRPARLCRPWYPPGENARVGCHALLPQIFSIQVLNLHLLHCRWILYWLSRQGSHIYHIFLIHSSINKHLIVSITLLLWIMLQRTWECRYLWEILISFPLVIHLSGIVNHIIVLFLIFWGNFPLFSIGTVPIYIPTNNVQGVPFPQTHSYQARRVGGTLGEGDWQRHTPIDKTGNHQGPAAEHRDLTTL